MAELQHDLIHGSAVLFGHRRIDGLSLSVAFTEESVHYARNFDYRTDDVIVASYPKSGTTLVQEIVYLLKHNIETDLLYKTHITERMPFIEYHGTCSNVPVGSTFLQDLPPPRVLKSHLPCEFLQKAVDTGVKIVYVVRNPKDTAVSSFNFFRSLDLLKNIDFATFLELFLVTDKICYGNVFDNRESFWRERSRPNILIVFYEDVLRDKAKEIAKIAQFLDENISAEQIEIIIRATSFESMKNNAMCDPIKYERGYVAEDPNFFVRGEIGHWREYFTESQSQRADDVIRERCSKIGMFYYYGD